MDEVYLVLEILFGVLVIWSDVKCVIKSKIDVICIKRKGRVMFCF